MPCVKQKYFSIGSLSILWSHDLYSESKVQATTISLWQIKNTENLKERKCSWKSAEGSLACQKSNLMWKEDHQSGPFPLNQKSLFGRALSKRRGEWNQTKTKQETVENPLTGSAVNGMHFSIQVTHPSRTSKTGLSLTPILTGSGYCEPLGAVLNSNTLCLCGMHKHQHRLIKQKGLSGIWFCFLTWLSFSWVILSNT